MPPHVSGLGANYTKPKSVISFSGLKISNKINHFDAIEKISGCHLDYIHTSLSKKTGSNFIQKTSDGTITYKKANALWDTVKYPFAVMPKEILNAFANKFNIESLQNSKMLTDFRKAKENEQYERAMRGLFQNGDAFLNRAAKKKGIKPDEIEKTLYEDRCPKTFKEIYDDVADNFYKLFDENLAPDKAKYNTTHERTLVKIVSGCIAAFMMMNDFYNKSIKNGKSDEEATKEAKSKRNQELLESGQEALSQYFLLGAFSSFTNNSTFCAPILNTALSTLFRITSRLSTGRPLTRIKAPEIKETGIKTVSMNSFVESIKNKKPIELEEIKLGNKEQKEKKKHLLSAKNIVLACLASIGAGFAIRKFKGTKAFDSLMNFKPIKTATDKFKNATTGELWVGKKEIEEFKTVLERYKSKGTIQYYGNKLTNVPVNKNGEIFIGEFEKFAKVPFTNIQMSKKELYTLPLAPLKIVKEVAFYPYKLVSAALEGVGLIKKDPKKELKNDYNLVNTMLDFRKQAEKFDNKTESLEFLMHYKKHLDNNRYTALNKETKSNVNNCDIGKLTALLGLFSSLYFSMTDDYNSTLKQTGDVEKANKDARIRGVNKIIRTSVQCVFMGLNDLFKLSYKGGLLGASAITAACTVLTDMASRTLSGMPFKKMNKEQLEEYNKNKKEGILKGYYDTLDKITD